MQTGGCLGWRRAQGSLWKRKGWKEMDRMRSRLEDLKELRDLVRSLGRGGGWGPLRRAPIQYLDMKVRPLPPPPRARPAYTSPSG